MDVLSLRPRTCVPARPRVSILVLCPWSQIKNTVFGLKLGVSWDLISRVLENLSPWIEGQDGGRSTSPVSCFLMAIGKFMFPFIMGIEGSLRVIITSSTFFYCGKILTQFIIFSVDNSVTLSTFRIFCNHHHYVLAEQSHLPKWEACILSVVTPCYPLPLALGNHQSAFYFYKYACSGHFIQWNHMWPSFFYYLA